LPFLDLPGIISTRSSCGEEMKCWVRQIMKTNTWIKAGLN
jgi:hypothetical protein